jgi:hypothetical protein
VPLPLLPWGTAQRECPYLLRAIANRARTSEITAS